MSDRTSNTINNITWAFLGQGLGLIVSFFARIAFIDILGKEYLGLNSLFTNILTVLSLAELGVGTSITYSLYAPLAEKDNYKVQQLMNLFKKVYTIIGIVIFVIGVMITPFLNVFIKDMPDIQNISLIYVLFVVNTSISYFFSYKRNLIIADQNRYIATIYRYACYIILNIVQVIFLIITHNYIVFLILQILFTIIENVLVSKKADKMYPFLKESNTTNLDKQTKNNIVKNTKAMMMHKIGAIVVNSTDNLLLSSFVGLAEVGLYSNYYMVIYALNTILAQVYNAVIPAIGNLCVESQKEKQYEIFKKINFLMHWLSFFCSICMMVLYNDFIEVWVGEEYLFNLSIVFILVLNFYLSTMRRSVLSFREAAGLFYKDRFKPIFEALINLSVSIVLALKFGTIGVFIGTTISTVTTCIWIEPYILYKYCFGIKLKEYFKEYIEYSLVTLLVGILTFYISSFVTLSVLLRLLIKLLICIIIPNLIFYLIYKNKYEFKYFAQLVINIINKIFTTIKK